MKYPGSKARLAKHLLPIITQHRTSDKHLYIEPFCGGCNMLDKVPGNRRAYDSNHYVIELFKALQQGWTPPENISGEKYKVIKTNPEKYPPELVAFVALQCSFGSKWFGGYARGKTNKGEPRNYAAEGQRHLLKQIQKLQGVRFEYRTFEKVSIPKNSIVYCDPPYAGTIKYKDTFNHEQFWEWVREISTKAYVYVSEYQAPDDFMCLKEILHKTTIDIGQHDARVERLFQHKEGLK